MQRKITPWLPVLCITFGAFVFNTSEFVPIGLLSAIAADFAMSVESLGWLLTIYAWVVAAASLPLMLLFSNTELKKLMLCVIALFVVSHALSALSSGFYTLLVSRIGVALSHALFWSIASPMAVRVAPKGKQSHALSFIIAGSSLALIAGLPLGRMVGLYLEWRSTFALIGIIALVIGIFFYFLFPLMPSESKLDSTALPKLLKNKTFIRICFLTLTFITAHFCAYTYIEPFLSLVVGAGVGFITFILCLFGLMGVVAGVLFSRYYDRHKGFFMYFCLCGLFVSLFLLFFISFSSILVLILCAFLGLCIMIFGLVFQSQVIATAKDSSMIAMSIFSGIYNVGIGGGAALGGAVSHHLGLAYIGLVGSSIALFALVFFALKMPFAKVFNRFSK